MPPKKKTQPTDTALLDVVPSLDDRLNTLMKIGTRAATRWGFPDAVAIPAYSPELFTRRVFSSGLLSLDHAVKIGGFPRGAITEFYGAPHTGKSLLLYMTIAEAQHECLYCESRLTYTDRLDAKGRPIQTLKPMTVKGQETQIMIPERTSTCPTCQRVDSGALCVLCDQENSFDPIWAASQGIELTKLFTVKLPTGEHVIEMLRSVIIGAKPDLVAIDSVAQLQPRTEQIKSDVDDKVMPGLHSKIMAQLCRHLTSTFLMDPRMAPAVIWVNQIRADMSGYGADKVTGGHAPEHYSCIRVKFSVGKQVNHEKPELGREGKFLFKKCKAAVGVKDRVLQYVLVDSGFDKVKDIYETALASGVFIAAKLTSGSHFWADDVNLENKLATSKPDAMERIRNDPEFALEIRRRVMLAHVDIAPPEQPYLGDIDDTDDAPESVSDENALD